MSYNNKFKLGDGEEWSKVLAEYFELTHSFSSLNSDDYVKEPV